LSWTQGHASAPLSHQWEVALKPIAEEICASGVPVDDYDDVAKSESAPVPRNAEPASPGSRRSLADADDRRLYLRI